MADRDLTIGIGVVILGGIALLAPALLSGGTGSGRTGHGSYGGMMGTGGAGWEIFGPLSQIMVVLLLVGGAALLYRTLTADQGTRRDGVKDSALAELRQSYARGELSDEEFETRRTKLRVDEDT
ncbi:MAG: SHOCT domain-containing protein [Halorhabdus sp.]